MYDEFGLTHKRFAYQELVGTAGKVAGVDLSDFFRHYVAGTNTLPITDWLKELGYDVLLQDYADEMYIRSVVATPLRKEWLSKNRFDGP
jgi:predicted metalloprotease with PDZ domain